MAPSEARFIVAVDFGTTFSGYAYTKRSEPDRVFTNYDWPCFSKAGTKPYCKTLTALYYQSSTENPGTFTVQDWGWSAFLKYKDTRRRCQSGFPQNPLDEQLFKLFISEENVLMVPQVLQHSVGFFATEFKLYLAEDAPQLPGDITVERMIVDYLKFLSDFIILDLQQKYGKHVTKEDVQWCLTVPAIWDESSKQIMKCCAEKAGMVMGAGCANSSDGSPLDIILEPEAASVYCQHKAKDLNLRKGDKILIVDVGGGTIDLVVHEKADDDPASMKVDEVVGSYGELGGGTFVDRHFFDWVCQKIGCFKHFCASNPTLIFKLHEWWQNIKMGFDGDGYSAEWPLPRKLIEAWEEYDEENWVDIGLYETDSAYYDELRVEDSDIRQFFDKEVDKVLKLIQKQIEGVSILMVVGGFSGSPYLRNRVKESFGSLVEEIITPEDPGSAICHGAVQLHIGYDTIQSRIAKRTYCIRTDRPALLGDPDDLLYINDDGKRMCRECLDVFVREGDKVPFHESVTKYYSPSKHNQKELRFTLYSYPYAFPKFTTDSGAKMEGQFEIDISEAMELDKQRRIEVTMVFGSGLICVTARRLNFGDPESVRELKVSFT